MNFVVITIILIVVRASTLWPISHVFKKGHRIQLDIDSNGAGFYQHAGYKNGKKNSIFMGGEFDSYLLLLIIPKH